MSYELTVDPAALRSLAKLPTDVREAIWKRLRALTGDPRPPQTEALTGNLKGLRKLRFGPYRAIYQIDDEALEVIVWEIGHRSRTYQHVARRRR